MKNCEEKLKKLKEDHPKDYADLRCAKTSKHMEGNLIKADWTVWCQAEGRTLRQKNEDKVFHEAADGSEGSVGRAEG